MPDSEPNSPPLRILLVESSKFNAEKFKSVFADSGLNHSLTITLNPDEALSLIRTRHSDFDILVTDHNLRGITGLELCLSIIEADLPLPKILLTSSGSEHLAAIALKAGVDDYIIKDADDGYLELLTVLLPEVVRNSRERQARHAAEEAVRESEEKFRQLFHNANDAIYLWRLEPAGVVGPCLEVNDVACRMLGYRREELLGKRPPDINAEESLPNIPKVTATLVEKGHTTFEMMHRTKTGKKIPVEISAHIFTFKGEKVVLSITRNISERKQAEEKIRQSEAKYRLLIENAGSSVIMVAADGTFLLLNSMAAAHLGATPELLAGKSIHNFFPPDVADRYIKRINEVIKLGRLDIDEEQAILPNGRRWVRATFIPIVDDQGKVNAVQIITHDITAQKEAEAELLESERRFRELADLLPMIVFELDHEGNFTYANRFAFRISGYNQSDLYNGFNIINLVTPDDQQRAVETVRRAMSGGTASGEEFSIMTKLGDLRYMLIETAPVRRHGKIIGVRSVAMDITRRKESELEKDKAISLLRYSLQKTKRAVKEKRRG